MWPARQRSSSQASDDDRHARRPRLEHPPSPGRWTHDGTTDRETIMIQAFRTQWRSDITVRSELSRRTLLGGLVAATGLARAGRAFASTDSPITPFRYRASAGALDDLKRRLAQTRW